MSTYDSENNTDRRIKEYKNIVSAIKRCDIDMVRNLIEVKGIMLYEKGRAWLVAQRSTIEIYNLIIEHCPWIVDLSFEDPVYRCDNSWSAIEYQVAHFNAKKLDVLLRSGAIVPDSVWILACSDFETGKIVREDVISTMKILASYNIYHPKIRAKTDEEIERLVDHLIEEEELILGKDIHIDEDDDCSDDDIDEEEITIDDVMEKIESSIKRLNV